MANAFIVYPAYSIPEYIINQNVGKVSQVEPYRKYDRNSAKEKDKKKGSYLRLSDSGKEKRDKRWETGDIQNNSDIGDPGFFFDCKM